MPSEEELVLNCLTIAPKIKVAIPGRNRNYFIVDKSCNLLFNIMTTKKKNHEN